jgi:hypothetical protein
LVDFDGDGRLDLLSGSNCCDTNGFHLFRRTENGSWAPRRRLEMKFPGKLKTLPSWRRFVTAADWNGDGVPDLLAAGPYGQGILVAFGPFKENEPITLSQEIDRTPKGETVEDFAVADWDRDGKPDLLVRQTLPDGRRGIYWYRNLGGAGLPKLAEGKLLVKATPDMQGFCVCDWNGDGWPDLIVTRAERVGENREGKPVDWRSTVWLYLRE